MQMKFKLRPALYFLIPYLLGIIVAKWVSLPLLWLWLTVLLCLIGSILTRNRKHFLCYGLLHLAVFAGGMLRLETVSHSPIPPHFYDQPINFSGTTVYQPERGEAWDACYATGELQLLSDPTQEVSAKFLIRFQQLVPLRYGRHITLTGVLRQPQGKRNLGGFDYRAYLARQDIVGIIDAKGLLQIGEQGGFLPLRWIEALRIHTERVIDVIFTDTEAVEPSLHAQLLKGILLGKRSDLPTETLDIFRNSGTFHVACRVRLARRSRRDVLLLRFLTPSVSTESRLSADDRCRADLRLPDRFSTLCLPGIANGDPLSFRNPY